MSGGEKTGTPVETRDLTGAAGSALGGLFTNQRTVDSPFFGPQTVSEPIGFQELADRLGEFSGRLSTASAQNMLGIDPDLLSASANAALGAKPFDLSNVYASLQPFDRREMAEAVAGTRGSFGTAGGRFSRNLLNAEARTRGEIGDRQARRREELAFGSFQDAENRRLEALGTILPVLLNERQGAGGQANNLLRTILGFGTPGAPVQDPGIIPGLLGAGANIAGVGLLPGGFLNKG